MNVLLGKKFLSQQILSGEIEHLPSKDKNIKLAYLLRVGQPVYVVSNSTFDIDVISYVGFENENFVFSVNNLSADTLKIHDLASKLTVNNDSKADKFYYLSKYNAASKAQHLCRSKLTDLTADIEDITDQPMKAMQAALVESGLPFYREDGKSFYVGLSPICENEKIKVVVERGLRVTVFKENSEGKFEPVTMVDDILQAIVAIKVLHQDLAERSETL